MIMKNMNCSVMSSQNVIITTAMAISGAVIFYSLYHIKNLPSSQNLPINQNLPLPSCLSSGELTQDSKKKKKKIKRVKFAENVSEKKDEKKKKRCEISGRIMPANRAALYHGILRDRPHRV
ncbi:hypothetical protein vseg_018434 [Gypsophila vaccaria]